MLQAFRASGVYAAAAESVQPTPEPLAAVMAFVAAERRGELPLKSVPVAPEVELLSFPAQQDWPLRAIPLSEQVPQASEPQVPVR